VVIIHVCQYKHSFNLKKITAHGAALLCGEQGGCGVGTGAGIHGIAAWRSFQYIGLLNSRCRLDDAGAPVAEAAQHLDNFFDEAEMVYGRSKYNVAEMARAMQQVVLAGGAADPAVQGAHKKAKDAIFVGEAGLWLDKTRRCYFHDREFQDVFGVCDLKNNTVRHFWFCLKIVFVKRLKII
jgi:hypothetical protein